MELPSPVERREGFLVGASVGAALAAGTAACGDAAAVRATLTNGEAVPAPAPSGRRRAATALADDLLAELVGGGVDLHRLGGRWVTWWREDGLEADPVLIAALDHLREFDAPVAQLPARNVAALAAALPAALASASPRAMIAGAFHVARMLDPDERTALCTVAMVVAAAELLDGHRDFVAEVVAALRANDAPPELVEPLRAIPRDPRTPPPVPRGACPDVVPVTTWVMWLAHHRPRSADALREMALAGGVSPSVGAVLGALLGARDGTATWPQAWIAGTGEEVLLRKGIAGRIG
jgi:hypothetical protein